MDYLGYKGLLYTGGLLKNMTQGINNISMENNNEIVSRLKFIGNIQSGDKINVRRLYVQPDGWVTRMSRGIFDPDHRGNTLIFVTNTISRAFEILKHLDELAACNLIQDIIKSKQGLRGLQSTYTGDMIYCCRIGTLMEDIDAKLTMIKSTHPSLFHENESEK